MAANSAARQRKLPDTKAFDAPDFLVGAAVGVTTVPLAVVMPPVPVAKIVPAEVVVVSFWNRM